MKRVRKRELPMVGRPEGQGCQRLELPQKREGLCYEMNDPDLHAAVGLCRTKPAGVAHTSAISSNTLDRVSPTHEWHLVFANAIEDIPFGLLP